MRAVNTKQPTVKFLPDTERSSGADLVNSYVIKGTAVVAVEVGGVEYERRYDYSHVNWAREVANSVEPNCRTTFQDAMRTRVLSQFQDEVMEAVGCKPYELIVGDFPDGWDSPATLTFWGIARDFHVAHTEAVLSGYTKRGFCLLRHGGMWFDLKDNTMSQELSGTGPEGDHDLVVFQFPGRQIILPKAQLQSAPVVIL